MRYWNFPYYFNSPRELLQNEWVLFSIVFLISFAMCYMALSSFFFKKKEQTLRDVLLGIKDESPAAKGPVIVISLCISLMISFAFTQSDYLYTYFSAGTVLAVLIFSIIVFILLTFPFYVAMEHSFSSKFAGPIFGVVVWAVLKWIFPTIVEDMLWRMPYQWRDTYEMLTSVFGFFIFLFAGFILGLIRNKK